jgi:molecular chaperone GrpE
MPANWTANEQWNDQGWPARGCPSWITWSGHQSDAVVQGVRSILEQALQVLEQLGYPRDAEPGVPFDPERHEVVGVVDHPDSAPGTVVEVLRPGYGEGSRQLRPAAVVVSRRGE